MSKRLLAVAAFAAFVSGVPAAAFAQSVPLGAVENTGTLSMLEELKSHKHHSAHVTGSSADSPLGPITEGDRTKPQFLPPVIDYTASASSNFATGPTGQQQNGLPGTLSGSVLIRVEPRTRVEVTYYELSGFPLSVDDGIVPIQIQGKGVLSKLNLQGQQTDVAQKQVTFISDVQRMFTIDNSPLVAALAYVSIDSTIGGRRGTQLTFENGYGQQIYIRDAQRYVLSVTEPFVMDDDKLLVTFNQGVTRLVHLAGFNSTGNHPQFTYGADFTYDINPKTSFFFLPEKLSSEFPSDRFPHNQATFYYGVSHRLRGPFFIQGSIGSISVTNPDLDGTGRIGITRLTLPCPPNPTGPGLSAQCKHNIANLETSIAPTFGGNKATTISLSLGVGTSPLIP